MGAFISWINKNADTNNSGEARKDDKNQAPSLSGMISTLVPVLVVSAVYFAFFLVLRRSKRRFYAPRTYLGSLREYERSPDLPNGWFSWIGAFWKIPDAYALQHQSLDAYLFIRYLRVLTGVCFASLCITWPVLFPINATGGNGAKELEILSYSNINIAGSGKHKLFAHCLIAWLVYGMLLYTVTRELIFYVNLRQAFLLSPAYAKRMSSRTVLFTSVPEEYQDEARIRQMFSDSVKNVWLVGDTKDLDKLIEERDKTAMKLEKGEVKLLKLVNKARVAAIKKGGSENVDHRTANGDAEHGSIASRWIPNKKRPSHRLGPLGLIGKKVDTIEWGREELHRIVPQADTAQADFRAGNFKKLPAVFVEFHTQSDAQAAYQVLSSGTALRMAAQIGIVPGDVVWESLRIPWWQLIIRKYLVVAFISVLIIFWAIPVGIVGVIAKVDTLKTLPGMSWIDKIPSVILGVISGLLPSVALSILMSLVPVIMRFCAKKAGAPSLSAVELYTQKAYFVFQLIQVFLIQSLTSTASQLIVEIAQNPSNIFGKLSEYIPQTSNFYISYFIVQGLTISMGVLTQVVGCFIFQLMYKYLAGTPRAMYTKWTTLSSLSWGSLMPVYTNIAVISIVYSVIAPLILFWSTLAMLFFTLAYRYNILFVTDTQINTQGLIYPRALKQLLSGIYIGEGVMIGMFIVSKAAGPAVLMFVFLILTILVNITINNALDPLLYSLPRSLQIEEELMQRSEANSELEDGQISNGTNGTDAVGKRNGVHKIVPGGKQGVQKDGNFVMKWLKPWIYADYETLRKLVPRESQIGTTHNYTEEVVQNAYWPPSVTSQSPILWIPEDAAGVSKQEVALTSKVIPITDEGCTLDDKNHIEWDAEGARPPIWEEKIYY